MDSRMRRPVIVTMGLLTGVVVATLAQEPPAAPPPDFGVWLEGVRAEALQRGISASTVDRALKDLDRKSTRLNSSHGYISYAVFCLKKKKQLTKPQPTRPQHPDTQP